MFTNTDGVVNEDGVQDIDALVECMFESVVSTMCDEEKSIYLGSDEVKAALEAGIIGKKTVVRLSKMDDLSRRIKLAALQKAKEDNASEWAQLRKNRIVERKLLGKIMQRYGTRVRTDAVKAQRTLLKVTPNAFTRPLGR